MRHSALIVSTLVLAATVVGCKKKEDPATGAAPDSNGAPPTVQVQGGQVSTREEDGLTRYSDEGPESGTVFTKHGVPLRTAADGVSTVLKQLGPGTGVNKKARHGAYYLVDFPTGNPGEMKPGWLLQTDVSGGPVAVHPPTTVPPVVAPPPGGGPPKIVVPGKH